MAAVPGGWQFVQYQLEAEQRLFGYTYAPPALNGEATGHLAQALFAAGVPDIRELALYIGTERAPDTVGVEYYECGQNQCERVVSIPGKVLPVWWLYNKRTNVRVAALGESGVPGGCTTRLFGESQIADTQCISEPGADGPIEFVNVQLPDRMRVLFSVQFAGPDRVAVFVPRLWREQSGWESFREALVFMVGIAAVAIPGFGAAIGSYVFGAQLAAAYPALTSIATNTALNAVLGGADVEHAVGRALASYAGASVGGFAGAQFDSQLAGRLTAAATTATLNGQDVGQAVASALLRAGASGIITFDTLPAAAPVQPSGGSMFFDTDTPEQAPIDLGGDPLFGDDGGGSFDYGASMFGDDGYKVDPGPLVGLDDGGGWSWDDALAKVTQVALAALQINKVYQASNSPAPKAAPPSQVVNKNGTITTRSPTGAVSTAKPAVGQPVVAADGSLIVNNGDGTYTTILPNGAQTTSRYPTAASSSSAGLFGGMDTQTLLLAGAAGLGILLLMRGRR